MKKIVTALLHAVIVVSTAWAVLYYFMGGTDPLGSSGTRCFRYFTTDSNILACVGSLVCLIYTGRKLPAWAVKLRYAGTAAVTITLLIVTFFLGPTAMSGGKGIESFLFFYEGNVFVLHLSTPVLAIITFLLPEKEEKLHRRDILIGMLPLVLYSIVYIVMVAVRREWHDWYGFTFGGRYELVPVVAAVMYGFTALIAFGLKWLQDKRIAKLG